MIMTFCGSQSVSAPSISSNSTIESCADSSLASATSTATLMNSPGATVSRPQWCARIFSVIVMLIIVNSLGHHAKVDDRAIRLIDAFERRGVNADGVGQFGMQLDPACRVPVGISFALEWRDDDLAVGLHAIDVDHCAFGKPGCTICEDRLHAADA